MEEESPRLIGVKHSLLLYMSIQLQTDRLQFELTSNGEI